MNRPQIVRFAAFVTVLAVLLGYVVYHRTSPETVTSPLSKAVGVKSRNISSLENYFVNYRMKRDRVMSQEIATLKSLMANPNISSSAKNQAASTLVRDTQELKQEMAIEGILSGRGFPLSAVTVTQGQVVVMVGATKLNSKQISVIADSATQVTNLPPQDVVILPKN